MVLGASPAEKDVARALHEPLALHNPETLMDIAAFSAWRLQHGPARLLDLKKEWIGFISEKQREITACANAPHSNNFHCTVLKSVVLEQLPSVMLHRLHVVFDEFHVPLFEILSIFLEVVDNRRAVLKPQTSVYDLS